MRAYCLNPCKAESSAPLRRRAEVTTGKDWNHGGTGMHGCSRTPSPSAPPRSSRKARDAVTNPPGGGEALRAPVRGSHLRWPPPPRGMAALPAGPGAASAPAAASAPRSRVRRPAAPRAPVTSAGPPPSPWSALVGESAHAHHERLLVATIPTLLRQPPERRNAPARSRGGGGRESGGRGNAPAQPRGGGGRDGSG